MPISRFSVAVDEVAARVRLRLAANAPSTATPATPIDKVAWADARDTIVLHLSTLAVRAHDGWLLCNLDANVVNAAKASTLQFLYFIGRDGNGAGTTAAVTSVSGDAAGASLITAWGPVLQRTIWDGVLDVLEGVLNYVDKRAAKAPAPALSLVGFTGAEGVLQVDVNSP